MGISVSGLIGSIYLKLYKNNRLYIKIMDYIEEKSTEEMSTIVKSIEKYLIINEYENAFIMFLLQSNRINFLDRNILIKHFNKYFKNKYISNK